MPQWKAQFRHAATTYLENDSDCQLFGCIFRDVEPHCKSLRGRVANIGVDCSDGTRIEMLAIHLPQNKLVGIGAEAL